MFAEIPYPYLLFLASGGHTQFVKVNAVGDYKNLGTTLDDACGECFDKVAKLLGYSYMGGREVERLAKGGDSAAFNFPRPLINSHGLDFSFSGLKTAVRLQVEKGGAPEDIAASFQTAVTDVISAKTKKALEAANSKALVASGGVAANMAIREELTKAAAAAGVEFFVAPPKYCVDNGVMIAHTAELAWKTGRRTGMTVNPRPRWPLSELSND
jgi:N6-L-threonylcarbamoyladenine synthase